MASHFGLQKASSAKRNRRNHYGGGSAPGMSVGSFELRSLVGIERGFREQISAESSYSGVMRGNPRRKLRLSVTNLMIGCAVHSDTALFNSKSEQEVRKSCFVVGGFSLCSGVSSDAAGIEESKLVGPEGFEPTTKRL